MKRRTLKCFLTWVIVLVFVLSSLLPANYVFAEPLPGNTYYVAMDGSDTNAGTIDLPFASITYAFQKLASGDTLIIREGTYKGYLQVIEKQNVTIKSFAGEKVVIEDGTTPVGYLAYIGGGMEADGTTPKTRDVLISGINFAFVNGENGVGMYIDPSSGVKVANCTFSGGEGGIVARTGAVNFDISSNIMHNCDWAYGGMLLFNAANGKVYNNVVYNSYFGVLFYGGQTTNNQLYNNTFYGNTLDVGVYNVSGVAHGNTFRNNIFSSVIQNQNHDNPDAPVDNFISLNSFDYNCYNSTILSDGVVTNDGFTLDQLKALGTPVEANGYTADPKFLNAATAEFQPGRGSGCIGKGTPELAPVVDALGTAQTNPPVTGAYVGVDRTNYYVAANGDDTNAGTDAAPFKTIAHGIAAMQSGDFLFIKGGTYAEGIAISGKNNITVENYQDEQPVITQLINIQDSSNVEVSGFSLNNSVVIGNSTNTKISRMDVNGGHIVVVPGNGTCSDGYEVSACKIHDFQGEGAILVYNGKNGSIVNNVIYNNKYQGILLEGGETINNNIYNNTIRSNSSDILLVYAPSIGNPSGNTVKNNIFSNILEIGSDTFFSSNVFDYNFYDNTGSLADAIAYANVYDASGAYSTTYWYNITDFQSLGQEQNGLMGNPYYLNSAINDFRLSSASECIGKGTADGAPAYDIKNIKREVPYDIGAYKYTGEVSDFYVSMDGSDDNPGTVDAPFATIQHAIDLLGVGGTIYIKGGTYDESLSIASKAGSGSNRYSIRSVDGEEVILSSSNQKETAISIGQGSSYWNIEGIAIRDYTKNGIEAITGANNIIFSNIKISDVGESAIYANDSTLSALVNVNISNAVNGISLNASDNWYIWGTCVNGASVTAASFNGSSNNTVVSSIFENSGIGMSLTGSSNLAVYNNDFYRNSQRDMVFGQASAGSAVKNNIFGSSGVAYLLEIADEASLNNDLDYNNYNKAAGAAAVKYTSDLTFDQFKALGKEAKGVLGDPKFTDPANGNFILQADSPCAKAGISDGNSPLYGFDGASFETSMDIGACFSPWSLKSYYVATDGDDNNDGSLEHPWKTIKKGMSSLKQSDTLYIRGGTYNERIDLYDMIGRPYTHFTVKNYNGEKVLLDSQFSQDTAIKFSNCAYWKVEGINFKNYCGTAIWTASGSQYITMESLEISDIDNPEFVQSGTEGILGDGGSNCTVKNCYIHDIGQTRRSQADHGIYIGYGSHGWVFDSNRIDNAPGSGIQFYGKPVGGDDCVIKNNVISNCKYGLILTMGMRNLITNNTFYNNWEYDLYMDWWFNDSTIQNNIFYNDLPEGMIVKVEDRANQTTKDYTINPVPFAFLYSDVSGNTFRNNIIYNENFGSRVVDGSDIVKLQDYLAYQTLNDISNPFTGNPKFTDADNMDFTLRSNSPCLDAGVEELAPVTDILGNGRIREPDLGAYERQNSNSSGDGPVIVPAPSGIPTPTSTPSPSVTPSPEQKFTDVEGNWAHKAIMNLAKAGILSGYSDGTVKPNADATRAEFVNMVVKMLKAESKSTANFKDTSSSAWYMKALAAAVENGWVDGRTDGSFGPGENITREEAMVIIARVMESLGVTSDSTESTLASFSDNDEISGWAKADAAKLVGLGIIKGSQGKLNPKAEITRAEICEILYRVMENYLNK